MEQEKTIYKKLQESPFSTKYITKKMGYNNQASLEFALDRPRGEIKQEVLQALKWAIAELKNELKKIK